MNEAAAFVPVLYAHLTARGHHIARIGVRHAPADEETLAVDVLEARCSKCNRFIVRTLDSGSDHDLSLDLTTTELQRWCGQEV